MAVMVKIGNALGSVLSSVSPFKNMVGKPYKILLLGERGAGKSSFVELLLNYEAQLENASFDVDKVRSLIEERKSKSTDGISQSSQMEKKIKCASDQMKSDTQVSTKYSLDFGQIKVDLIDTPGFGDTEGKSIDDKHLNNIIEKVKKDDYINCVCLVVNGTRPRMTETMTYVFETVIRILPSSVLDNIIVVCTNVSHKSKLSFKLEVLSEKFELKVKVSRRFLLENAYSN